MLKKIVKHTRKTLRRTLALMAVFSLLVLMAPGDAAATRIKDIVDFEGVRDNMLVGYGLVVGLNGTGDSLRNSPFTEDRKSVV